MSESRHSRPLDLATIEEVLQRFDELHVAVVGDVLLDEYLWGDVERISPEAPVPVVRVERSSVVLGGAGNVARNVIALGASCALCSAIGDDGDGRSVRELVEELGVSSGGLVEVAGRPTTRKTRVVARSQQLVRVDLETVEALPSSAADELQQHIDAASRVARAAILEDYGKGLLTAASIEKAMASFRAAGVAVAVDPKRELQPFRGASLVKPNLREAEALTGMEIRSTADVERAAGILQGQIGGGAVAITRGGEGISLLDEQGRPVHVPTPRQEVFDVQGAGDTTIASLALALAAGASLREAAVIANAAAGTVVGKIGTATASRDEVRQLLPRAIAAAEERT